VTYRSDPPRASSAGLTLALCVSLACSGGPPAPPPSGGPVTEDERVLLKDAGAPATLKVDGQGRTTCRRSDQFEGTGTIDLNDRLDQTPSCRTELAAFTIDRAVAFDKAPAWTHDPSKPVELRLEPPLPVELRVYLPQAATGLDTEAREEIDEASGLFTRNRAGIVFVPFQVRTYSPTEATTIGDDCGDAATLVKTGGALYDPLRINVYYVDQIGGANVFKGYTCFAYPVVVGTETVTGENIIYIAQSRVITTLAHELGHMLGLRGNVGHTNGMADFTVRNLMLTNLTLDQQKAQDHFSLGQGYRMSLDQASWVNHARPTSAPAPRTGDSRVCQLDPQSAPGDPCPPLAWDRTASP
jgi:hypothetical protein